MDDDHHCRHCGDHITLPHGIFRTPCTFKPSEQKFNDWDERRVVVRPERSVCKVLRMLQWFIGKGLIDCAMKCTKKDARLGDALLFAALGVPVYLYGIEFGPGQISLELVQQICRHGSDPMIMTTQFRSMGRSAWHLFLRSWVRQAWEVDFEPNIGIKLCKIRTSLDKIDSFAWQVARELLKSGASPYGTCCVAAGQRCGLYHPDHSCRTYSVIDILLTCTPLEHQHVLDSFIPNRVGDSTYMSPRTRSKSAVSANEWESHLETTLLRLPLECMKKRREQYLRSNVRMPKSDRFRHRLRAQE